MTFGAGGGRFLPPTAVSVPAGFGADIVEVEDLDGDGTPDIVTNGSSPGGPTEITVLLSNGDRSFRQAATLSTTSPPASIAIGDLDGDEVPDLVSAGFLTVGVRFGNGDGTFQSEVPYETADSAVSTAIADLDGDAVPDVAVLLSGGSVILLSGTGDGSLGAPVTVAPVPLDDPRVIRTDDFDSDGVLDLAIAMMRSDEVLVFRGRGDGTFEPSVAFPTGRGPASLVVADLDRDGNVDLTLAGMDVSVLIGNGDGSFRSPMEFEVAGGQVGIAASDFDRDGFLDLVTVADRRDTATVLINLSPDAPGASTAP